MSSTHCKRRGPMSITLSLSSSHRLTPIILTSPFETPFHHRTQRSSLRLSTFQSPALDCVLPHRPLTLFMSHYSLYSSLVCDAISMLIHALTLIVAPIERNNTPLSTVPLQTQANLNGRSTTTDVDQGTARTKIAVSTEPSALP